MKSFLTAAVLIVHVLLHAEDFAAQQADRAAIERVYHAHRIGTKQTFEQAMPAAMIEQLVEKDQRKQAVLKAVYHAEITPAMLAAEVQRIHATTRAPEMLAEIKAALGHAPARFANAFVKPILVERELHRHFDTDDALHAPQRREAEQARASLLAGKPVENMREATWLLGPRPAEPQQAPAATTPTQVNASSSAYTVEATAQLSQVLGAPTHAESGPQKVYFADLDPELQRVLRVQLLKAGDVSAVIETPGSFLIFQAKDKTAETLTAASLSIPKRSYEEWLAQQPAATP